MVEAGMKPPQAFVAATSRAAHFVGLPDRGALASGKRADMLVLDANPLDDIRSTRRIAKLYLAGAEVDRAAIKASPTRLCTTLECHPDHHDGSSRLSPSESGQKSGWSACGSGATS
jgi:adenine deaminase